MTWAVKRERGMHHTQRRADAIGDGSHTCRTDCAGAHCATAALDRTEVPVGCTPSAGRAAGRASRAGRTVSQVGRDVQAALPSTMSRASRAAGRAGWLRRATPTTGRAGAPAEHKRVARTTTASTAPARKKRETRGGGERGREKAPNGDEWRSELRRRQRRGRRVAGCAGCVAWEEREEGVRRFWTLVRERRRRAREWEIVGARGQTREGGSRRKGLIVVLLAS